MLAKSAGHRKNFVRNFFAPEDFSSEKSSVPHVYIAVQPPSMLIVVPVI